MKIKYLILIILLLILTLELFIRLLFSMPSSQQYDDELGYTNIPGSLLIESQEGYGRIIFNRLGFNDDQPNKLLKRKIFVIGDSYTEALQLSNSLIYTSLLESSLNDYSIDIIKLARDSFIPFHYPIISKRYYDEFTPEFTLIQFGSQTVSDLYDDNLILNYDDSGNITDYRIHASSSDKNKDTLRILVNNSALIYHLMRKYKYLILQTINSVKLFLSDENMQAKNTRSKKEIPDEEHSKRLSYVIRNIKGKVVCMYIPSPSITYEINEHSNRISNIINQACIQSDAGFIDLTPAFEKEFSANKKLLSGFSNSKPGTGHLNANGHKLVAEQLLAHLISMGLIY